MVTTVRKRRWRSSGFLTASTYFVFAVPFLILLSCAPHAKEDSASKYIIASANSSSEDIFWDSVSVEFSDEGTKMGVVIKTNEPAIEQVVGMLSDLPCAPEYMEIDASHIDGLWLLDFTVPTRKPFSFLLKTQAVVGNREVSRQRYLFVSSTAEGSPELVSRQEYRKRHQEHSVLGYRLISSGEVVPSEVIGGTERTVAWDHSYDVDSEPLVFGRQID